MTQNTQNHRIVFLVDGSGSMINSSGMATVMNQIIILRRFCQQEGIKFQCLLFTSYSFGYYHDTFVKEDLDLTKTMFGPTRTKESFDEIMKEQGGERAVLLDIVNDTDSDEYFNRVYHVLVRGRLGDFGLGYGNTPINESMEDKLNLIVLTDGSATDGRNKRTTIIKDAKTRREYTYEDLYGTERMKRNYRRGYSYYYMDRSFHPQFVVCQLLKERGICHSIVYYNCVYGCSSMVQTDVAETYWKEMGFTQNPGNARGSALSKEKPVSTLNSKGLYVANEIIPYIDSVYWFKNPDMYAYRQQENYHRANRTGTAKEHTLVAKEFRAQQAALQVYKAIVLGVAKYLG